MDKHRCSELVAALLCYIAEATPSQAEQARRIVEFVSANGAPWRRSTRSGHLTASAWITDVANERALLIHHKKLNKWLQPGGHIDDDDMSFVHAALREAKEETGLANLQLAEARGDAIFDVDVHHIPARADEPAHLHYDIRFRFVTTDEGLTLNRNESHAIQWFKRSEIENDTFIDPSVRRMAAIEHGRS
jgi:8-oxo-dGTP pyrophosphatase MutT (NUDIX family)